ncbi:MAG TPA: hypothetical protein VMR76_02810, partial [Candidatus Saccharimonadia bacterium]|nr:hypothetical protein [Candidatus Saccharimonadia bacterium]
MKQNITVQLDQSTIKEAKVLAAKRSTSLSKFLAEEIRKIAEQESTYDKDKKVAISRLQNGYSFGGVKLPKREELY